MKIFKLAIVVSFLINPCLIKAQINDPVVKVTGEVITPLTINADVFQKFKQITVNRKDKDGKDHTYTGVALADILEKAVVNKGTEKGAELTKYLLAEASDGYKAIFTLTELDKAFTDRQSY